MRFLDVGSDAVPCTVSGKECVYRDSCPTAAIVLYCATSVLGDGKLYWLQREDACK